MSALPFRAKTTAALVVTMDELTEALTPLLDTSDTDSGSGFGY